MAWVRGGQLAIISHAAERVARLELLCTTDNEGRETQWLRLTFFQRQSGVNGVIRVQWQNLVNFRDCP